MANPFAAPKLKKLDGTIVAQTAPFYQEAHRRSRKLRWGSAVGNAGSVVTVRAADVKQSGGHGGKYYAGMTTTAQGGFSWAKVLSAKRSNWKSGKHGFWYSGDAGVEIDGDTVNFYVKQNATTSANLSADFNSTPYLRSDFEFKRVGRTTDPATPPLVVKRTNSALSCFAIRSVVSPGLTLMVGFGNDTTPAHAAYSKNSLPELWLTDPRKPPWRHMGGANYLFVDGHVAWLRPHELSAERWGKDLFSIK